MRAWLQRLLQKNEAALTPEQEVALADQALRRGELTHAALHLGAALATDPQQPHWLAALDRLVDLSPDPLALAPIEEQNYVGTLAVRAYILHRLQRTPEALGLVLQCARAKPETPYLHWATAWLSEHPDTLEEAKPFLSTLISDCDAGRAVPAGLLGFLEAVLATATGPGQSELRFFLTGVLRRIGEPQRAIVVAQESYAAEPNYFSAIGLGAALRDTDPTAALVVYQAACAFLPDDAAAFLDMGDVQWQQGNHEEARRAYEQALLREPEQPWAWASLLALQDRWDELERYAAENPTNVRAQQLLGRQAYYFGTRLVPPTEALINMGRQLLEEGHSFTTGDSFAVTLSAIESPSAVWALRRQLGRLGFTGECKIAVSKIGRPDPRLPRRTLRWPLWRYEGTEPFPAVPAPSPAVAEAIAQQAALPYDFEAWAWRGKGLAQKLGSAALGDVLATMALPPSNPTALPEWDWAQRVAIAAALILAHADSGPWEGSRRRELLLDLLAGPVDGSLEAAALALVVAVRNTPEAEAEVTRELLATLKHYEHYGAPNLHAALLSSLLQLPSLKPVLRQKLQETLKAVLKVS